MRPTKPPKIIDAQVVDLSINVRAIVERNGATTLIDRGRPPVYLTDSEARRLAVALRGKEEEL